jgi:hypothetical protein
MLYYKLCYSLFKSLIWDKYYHREHFWMRKENSGESKQISSFQ